MMQVRFNRGPAKDTRVRDRPVVCRFPPRGARSDRGRAAIGATIALITLLGSLAAATLGSAIEEALPYPLLVLLTVIRG